MSAPYDRYIVPGRPQPVDVLAVLENIAEETRGAIGWPGCRELAARLDEVHAAIAELIEAANVLSDKSLQRTKLTASVYTSHVMRLRAALRAVGGAK